VAKLKRASASLAKLRGASMFGALIALNTTSAGVDASFIGAAAVAPASAGDGRAAVPAWVFPMNPPATGATAAFDCGKPLRVPQSNVVFSEAQLNDLFSAPDWHPGSHSAMPEIVARGRAPDVYACGYCHTPGGQGRPENAALAGLPAPYIIQQLKDFKSGVRRSAWRGSYRPADLMIHEATLAAADEVASAAQYFSKQTLMPRVLVVERARVPRSRVVGWVYAAIPGAGDERLGQRLLEFAPDAARHENRDDEMRYIAYAPMGSVGRGRSMAGSGANGLTVPCGTCHGDKLHGVGLVPQIAGRSPTYILRQLLAFQTGARAGATGQPMLAVVARLNIANMIDAAAYAASLPP
jgi:cytochrome c553